VPVNTVNLGPGGTANWPAGQLAPTGGIFSAATDQAVIPGFTFASDTSLGWYRSGVSTVALSYGTLNLFTGAARLSLVTLANANGMVLGQIALIFQASGVSWAYSSGATTYFFGGSTLSAVQA